MDERRRKRRCFALAAIVFAAALALRPPTAFAPQYDPYSAISSISISQPSEGQICIAQRSLPCYCYPASDYDYNLNTSNVEEDSVTEYWTCSSGYFDMNGNIGTNVTFVTPSSGGQVTLTAYADDNYAPANNDALADEDPVSASVHILVIDSIVLDSLTPDPMSVNESGITLTAHVTAGGNPAPNVQVYFSSNDLYINNSTVYTDSSGVATTTASAGWSPSSYQGNSSASASVSDGSYGPLTDTKYFTIVAVNYASPYSYNILVGHYTRNDLYTTVITFGVSPAISGLSISIAFTYGGNGVNYPATLEEASYSTDGNGQATVRLRSSDLRETAGVGCTFRSSSCSAYVTFDGITDCPGYDQ